MRIMVSSLFSRLSLLLLTLTLAACSSTVDEPEYVERSVEEIYNQAYDSLLDRNFRRAALEFDEVERQHPYSVWARRAMLMSAYSYYQQNKYSDAVLTARRFLALHPGNKNAPYAYYLIAQCYYEQISDVSRDQKNTELALSALIDVIRRYPETDYARDATLKLDLTYDHLAGKEMEVGRFYMNRQFYIAAIKRFTNVLLKYQTTSHVEEALHRLTEIYLTLGIENEAQATAAVLGYNYPDSEWYKDSYRMLVNQDFGPEEKTSWFRKVWQSIF